MAYYKIIGGKNLDGMISVSGAKNAAVAAIPAVILCGQKCTLTNIPDIEDVRILKRLLEGIGAKVDFDSKAGSITIDPSTINTQCLTCEPMRQMRASYYFLGALLGKFGYAKIALPGGCRIGERPIDLHIKGMDELGADVCLYEIPSDVPGDKKEVLEAKGMLVGRGEISLKRSVGATINVMMAASAAKEGITVISNPAKEPHIVDVANFINAMGGNIRGAGTDKITITATKNWHGCTYEIIPDQIETGTYMIATAAAGGRITLKNVIPKHMEALTKVLRKCGVIIEEGTDGERDYLRITSPKKLLPVNFTTEPYPGFPTDLQQPMTAMLSIACGDSTVTETLFENRFNHVAELKKMGAKINVSADKKQAFISGVNKLQGADVTITDLRAGAALVVAALAAEGETKIHAIKYLDRGYEKLADKLSILGATIERIEEED